MGGGAGLGQGIGDGRRHACMNATPSSRRRAALGRRLCLRRVKAPSHPNMPPLCPSLTKNLSTSSSGPLFHPPPFEQYYSTQWLNGHMLSYCESGSGTQTQTKECVSVGRALPLEKQREFVQQLSKGCFPGVIHNAGGGQCNLPGYPEPW
jgi:hypothetical protein